MNVPNVQTPQSFVVREECEKAAWQNGYRRKLGETDGWAAFGSTTAQGAIYLAAAGPSGPWLLALDHGGVVAELDAPHAPMQGPGLARYAFATLGALYAVLPRVYQLAASLPDAPLHDFQAKTQHLPKSTEAERLIVQRVGQNIFRNALDCYWGGACAITGIKDRTLLRASHIKPWAVCYSDAERLDVFNGLLLAAHYDAAFDAALISFAKDGAMIHSVRLSADALILLSPEAGSRVSLTDKHQSYLDHHRARFAALETSANG